MGFFDLFSKKQREANQSFLSQQRSQQSIAKIEKLTLPANLKQQLIDADVFDIWFSDKDLAPLVKLLADSSEMIKYTATGINNQSEASLLVCTNQRLIVISKKRSDLIVKTILLDRIKSVLLRHQIVYDEITLVVDNEQIDFNSINKISAAILADDLRALSKLAQGKGELDKQVEQIKKLKELVDQGILTEEEFQAKKKKILDI
uniref:SHOCT domain-containing protein n=1 Tax=Lactobacillus acidophilus TaxID=1579 RepID=UPI003F5645A6